MKTGTDVCSGLIATLLLLLGFGLGCSDSEEGDGSGDDDGGTVGRRDDGGRSQPDTGATSDSGPTDAATGSDTTQFLCHPNEPFCTADGSGVGLCNEDGTDFTTTACPEDTICFPNDTECLPGVCVPRVMECIDLRRFRTCNDDGQNWGAIDTCEEGTYCNENMCSDIGCLPSVMFAIDGSSSMSGEWETIRRSLNAVMQANPEVTYGLSMFPTALGCTIGDGGTFSNVYWPHVPIQPAAVDAIDEWFETNDAAGGATPLVSTIEWFAENATYIWGELTDNGYLVVMTEGADTCRCDDDEGMPCIVDELTDATNALRSTGVKTYVIGYRYGDAPEALNTIASHGGTEMDEYIAAGSEETLVNAFQLVLSDVKLCP